ncbi:hypothetical protein DFH09DRAFT_1362415 [Mycena vulgaris]|nr:hypothetical protein DFH09DRAFT_1362415 [Mycena vulgaris]
MRDERDLPLSPLNQSICLLCSCTLCPSSNETALPSLGAPLTACQALSSPAVSLAPNHCFLHPLALRTGPVKLLALPRRPRSPDADATGTHATAQNPLRDD